MRDKVAIITGSSRGIGKATAIALGDAGCIVILNGRSESRLKEAVSDLLSLGIRAEGIAGDLSDPQVAEALVEEVVNRHGRLDILVNNAGLSMRGRFDELDPEVFTEILNANVINAMNMARFALPHLQPSEGSLVFVSSVVGLRALPMTSVYSAAKMALTGLAEALRMENKKQGVHIGVVYVGYTQNAPDKTTMNAQGELVLLKPREGGVADSPEGVARLILSNIQKRKFKSVHSLPGKLNSVMNRFFPSLVETALYAIYKRKPELFE
ncbi:MAG: SDR family oxidoreductase [Bacteroidia bacterium]|nr:SDR family oxidoreductase [Bacteroidia bacterium]